MGRQKVMEWYRSCNLCARKCKADRSLGQGACKTPIKMEEGVEKLPLARAALHYWEEPCISGENGSGAVFFSGCNLGCVFCQNREISTGVAGKYVSVDRLSEIFLELQDKKANNINLVTAGHVLPLVIKALEKAKKEGLIIPVLYNTSSYETAESVKVLDGLVDIYLPDLKYSSSLLAAKFSGAADYPEVARAAIDEMYRQTGEFVIGEDGLIKKGLVIRHLVLPGCTQDSREVIRYIYERYGDSVMLSIMNQYTPRADIKYNVLRRRVKPSEYNSVIDYAIELGITNAYMQSNESAEESYIPAFDYTGV